MIKLVTMYSVVCDRCGKTFCEGDTTITGADKKSARGYASGGIRTHAGVSPTDFESVTSASSITLACSSLLAYNTQIFINCQEKK